MVIQVIEHEDTRAMTTIGESVLRFERNKSAHHHCSNVPQDHNQLKWVSKHETVILSFIRLIRYLPHVFIYFYF